MILDLRTFFVFQDKQTVCAGVGEHMRPPKHINQDGLIKIKPCNFIHRSSQIV